MTEKETCRCLATTKAEPRKLRGTEETERKRSIMTKSYRRVGILETDGGCPDWK